MEVILGSMNSDAMMEEVEVLSEVPQAGEDKRGEGERGEREERCFRTLCEVEISSQLRPGVRG